MNMPNTYSPYSGSDHVGGISFKGTKRVWDLLDCAAVQTCQSKKMRLTDAVLQRMCCNSVVCFVSFFDFWLGPRT